MSMSNWGGRRDGAGRPAGSKNTATIAKEAEIAARIDAIKSAGVTPLEFFIAIMRDDVATPEARFAAAKEAAPYMHAKLAAVEHSGALAFMTSHEDALAELEAAADSVAADNTDNIAQSGDAR